jgi:hypothetical protein
MPCPELGEALQRWRDGDGETPFFFSADGSAVQLRRLASGVLIGARLALRSPDEALLQEALRLGQPSLARFPGALARDPADGRLWLLHRLADGCTTDDLLDSLETLLNQRDTWQSMLGGEPSPLPVKSRPLNLPPGLIGEGTRYA